jgi:phage replication initiation protein
LNPSKTTVDWLRFRAKAEPRDILETLRPLYGDCGFGIKLQSMDKGILGFKRAAQIIMGDMPMGRMDFGGESQRDWVRVDLTGKACEWVQDWNALSEVESLPAAEIRRLDIALTTWDGEVTHDRVVQAHTDGRFASTGRPPVLQQITSSDPRAGRTCYIGKREQSDKFGRCYEKGFEMAAKAVARHSALGYVTHIDDKQIENIYRCELELKAVTKDIPWEVVERRDQYFAGAYPFFGDILPNVEADILQRRPERAIQADLAMALENCRIQFGPTLFTAMMAYQGDITAVWDKVVGKTHNKSLLEAGVLLVDHE